jgi:hypothetical protein
MAVNFLSRYIWFMKVGSTRQGKGMFWADQEGMAMERDWFGPWWTVKTENRWGETTRASGVS